MTKVKEINLRPLVYFMLGTLVYVIGFTDKFSITGIKMIAILGLINLIFDRNDFLVKNYSASKQKEMKEK